MSSVVLVKESRLNRLASGNAKIVRSRREVAVMSRPYKTSQRRAGNFG